MIRNTPSPAMVVACIALVVALAGTSVAAVTAIPRNSVGAKQLRRSAVTMAKIKDGAVTSAAVMDGSLVAADFTPGQLSAGPAGPAGDRGPQGPAGERGLQGPSGVVSSAAALGGGPNPSAITQFFGTPAAVTITHPSQRVFVDSTNAFGTLSSPAGSLNLFICYQRPGGELKLFGNGLLGMQLPPNTKVPMGFSRILTLPVGQYSVGLCGTGGANWTNNDWGSTTALVFEAPAA